MKRNRIAILVSAVLVAAIALSGCGKDNNTASSGQGAASTAGSSITSANTYSLEMDGKMVEVDAKSGGKEVRSILNALKESKVTQSPEDEEASIYVEWTADDDSYYAFVYQMADGTSLVELSAANADEPTFYEGATTYQDLETILNAAG